MYGLPKTMRVVPVTPVCILSIPSIGFVDVFVCWKLAPYLRVGELDHRCLLSLCCLFV